MTTLTLKDLKQEFRLHSSGDAWGDAMAFAFPLCETLYERNAHDIPGLMQFSPGAGGVSDDPDDMIRQSLKEYDTATLEQFGLILNRLLDILRTQGRDH